MVDVDGDVFAMPIESVVEIVSVGGRDLTTLFGQRTARVRGRVVSVVRLDDVFCFNRGGSGAGRNQGDELTLVIVGESGHEIGLAVDRVIGEEDVVIKSMAENYKNIAGIAGASVLGNGQVSLILDVPALIGMASNTVCANA
jgi:two-component system chemotaxis sensor kinase CheA